MSIVKNLHRRESSVSIKRITLFEISWTFHSSFRSCQVAIFAKNMRWPEHLLTGLDSNINCSVTKAAWIVFSGLKMVNFWLQDPMTFTSLFGIHFESVKFIRFVRDIMAIFSVLSLCPTPTIIWLLLEQRIIGFNCTIWKPRPLCRLSANISTGSREWRSLQFVLIYFGQPQRMEQ